MNKIITFKSTRKEANKNLNLKSSYYDIKAKFMIKAVIKN